MPSTEPAPTGPDAAARVATPEEGATAEAALELFDSLAPVTVEHMLGAWRGSGLDTGNPLDGPAAAVS